MKNRQKNFWMVLLLIITLMANGIQAPYAAAEELKQGTISVIGLDGNEILLPETTVPFADNETATEVLVKTVGENNVELTETQYGNMITGILGFKAEGNFFWAFYINGESASVGSDSYIVQNGDQLSFRYTDWTKPGEGTDTDTPAEDPVVPEVDITSAVNAVTEYVMSNPISEWDAIALKQMGKTIPVSYLEELKNLIKEKDGKFSRITDTERYILGILAAGGDPSNIEGFNLVESVYNGNVTKQGLIGVAYALIALDSAGFEIPDNALWTREKLVRHLLDRQNQDGGWAWDESTTSDPDTTGMILVALAPYMEQTDVKEMVDLGIQYLSAQYQDGKVDNSSTAAQTVIALSALGIDANGSLFSNDNGSLLQYLLTFQNSDGGFDWQGGDDSDVFSTQQGVQALAAYQLFVQGKGSLYNLPVAPQVPVTEKPEEEEPVADTTNDQGNQDGYPLPNTATDLYNILALGLLLAAIGSVYFFKQSKRNA